MKYRSLAAVIAIALMASPAAAVQDGTSAEAAAVPLLSAPPLSYTTRTLANGAKLHALRDPSASVVAVNVWYDVGQRDDPVGRGGFAHLFEHLMFKQTRNLPDGVTEFVSDIGGSVNATTLFDSTVYTALVPASQLEAMLWLEGERMRNLVVDEANFRSERDVVKEELRQRIFASSYGRILHLLIPAYGFGDHPYARPIGGTMEELDAAPLSDVRAFYEAYYRPDNAIFVVSGNFDPEQLDTWADKYIGSIPRPSRPIPRDEARMGDRDMPLAIDAYAPNVPLPALVFSWHAPPAENERAVAGLGLIEAMLTRGASGRLNRVLVHETGIATDVSHYYFNTEDGHAFAIVATLAEGRKVEEAEKALAGIFSGLRERPVSKEELRAAKNGILADALASRETVEGRAFVAGDGAALLGDPGAADRRLELIRAMTPAEVQRIASEWLARDARLTIRYRDESEKPQGYQPPPGADIGKRGTRIPSPSRPPVSLASGAEIEAPPPAGDAPPRAVPDITERGLPNGMDLVLVRSGDVPLTTLQLVIGGGDSADPEEHSGLADMLAALAPRGTASRDAQSLADAIAALGGRISTEAQADATIVSLTVPTVNAERAGALLADIALHPTFPEAEIGKERQRQLDTLTLASKQPVQTALRTIPAMMFAGTGYEAIPTSATLTAITRDDLLASHHALWRPDNATLIVTGSLGPNEAAMLAERVFGAWETEGEAPHTPAPPVSRASYAPRVVAVNMPRAGQTAVLGLLPMPGRASLDYPALQFANAILGGGQQGWLNEEIRIKRGLTYGAGSLLMLNKDAGAIVAVARTKNESAVEVAELIEAQLSRLQSEPITDAMIANREAYLDMALARSTDTTSALAAYLGSHVAAGAPLSEAVREMRGDADPSATRIKAVASELLNPERASLLFVGDSTVWIDTLAGPKSAAQCAPVEIAADAPPIDLCQVPRAYPR